MFAFGSLWLQLKFKGKTVVTKTISASDQFLRTKKKKKRRPSKIFDRFLIKVSIFFFFYINVDKLEKYKEDLSSSKCR